MSAPHGGRLAALLLVLPRSLRRHALTTWVTILSCALASGLVVSVWSLEAQARRSFGGGGGRFDGVFGARGSPLELVLSAVYGLEASPGNLPYALFRRIADDPRILRAVPLALGDNYRGFRIVGTTPDYFRGGEGIAALVPKPPGRFFDPARSEVVLGSRVAVTVGLRVGDRFHPAHGDAGGGRAHEEQYVVAGVLSDTGTPVDLMIFAPLESVWRMKGHVLRGTGDVYEPRPGEEIPEEHREVSAVLLKVRSPMDGFSLDEEWNRRGKAATFAWPVSRIMAGLLDRLGWFRRVLTLVAYLVMVTAAGSILTGIYNSMEARRRDLAILRALGAGRKFVFSSVVCEGSAMGLAGGILGDALGVLILAAAAAIVRAQTGVRLEVLAFHPAQILVPAGMCLLGGLAGLLPAARAYSTDVAGALSGGA